MGKGRIPYLKHDIDPRKPLRECDGVGKLEPTDSRTIEDLSNHLARTLLELAQISAASPEILIGVQQNMHRKAQELLANPATKELGEALQRLALRVQTGVGNPPKQQTERAEAASSPFRNDLWCKFNLSARTSKAVENFLTEKFGIDKKDLTVRHFYVAFSRDGHFDPREFKNTNGIGDTTFNEFMTVIKEEGHIITETDDWDPSFLEKHSLKS